MQQNAADFDCLHLVNLITCKVCNQTDQQQWNNSRNYGIFHNVPGEPKRVTTTRACLGFMKYTANWIHNEGFEQLMCNAGWIIHDKTLSVPK